MTFNKGLAILLATCLSATSQAASVWKVSSGENELYVGGTIHMLTAKDYPLPVEYHNAYKLSDKLVFETDMAAVKSIEFQQSVMAKLTYKDGVTIDKVLTPKIYADLESHLASRGIPIAAFALFKPSLIAITLSVVEFQKMGFNQIGVDEFFSNMANEQNKPQSWLESPDEQIAFLMNMGKNDENAMIEYSLRDIKKMPTVISQLQTTWRSGDMQGMAEVGIKDFKKDYPEIYKDLLVTRNNNWLPQIKKMLNDKPVEFVLVGALHLSGPDSVLAKLKASGYKIEKL